jgi:hypothetical protein
LLIPFSKDKVDYVHDFKIKSINYYNDRKTILIINNLTKDITSFLNNLSESDNYWVSFSFYPELAGYSLDEAMRLTICDPILINKDSSSLVLTNFIMNRLQIMIDFYYLDDSVINSTECLILAQFTEIELA